VLFRSELSLVIPCWNEARGLPTLVDRCAEVFGGREGVELVLVDNGSTDDTPRLMAELLAPLPWARSVRVPENRGYGHGILTGLRTARGRVIGWTHADLQTDPADALRGLECFGRARDAERLLVKGRRYGRPAFDVVFTWGMAAFESVLLRAPLWDINAQPTLFPRSFFETWEDPPTDFSLDLYAYWKAKRDGFEIERFPVHFGPRAFGASTWNTGLQARWRFIRRTVDYSLKLAREKGR